MVNGPVEKITFITSNALKLKEVKAILGNNSLFQIELVHRSLLLPKELQAAPEKIAIHKCKAAAEMVEGPLLIEDSALAFNSLNGLPGPYIKTFIAQLGLKGLVRILSDFQDKTAIASCTFAYTKGRNKEVHLFTGIAHGTIVASKNYKDQQNWDPIFQPEGYKETYAKIGEEKKNRISPRYKALLLLKDFLLNTKQEISNKEASNTTFFPSTTCGAN